MGGMYDDPTTNPDAFDAVIFNDTLRTPGKVKVTGWHRPVEYDHKAGKGTKGAEQTLKGLPPAKGSMEFETWTPAQRAAWAPILDALHFDPTKLGSGATAASITTSTAATASAVPLGQISGFAVGGQTTGIPAAGQVSSFTGNTPNTTTANQPKPLSSAFAIAVYYPTLADIDVHFILPPEKIGAWEPVGEDYSHMKRTIECVEYTGQPPNKSIAATPTGSVDASSAPASPGAATPAGAPGEGAASGNTAGSQSGAGADAQGAWGAP